MITFRRAHNDGEVAGYLAAVIAERLSRRQKVLWLVAGGSAMDVAVRTAAILKDQPLLSNLSITLTDERYGAIGHPDSNWRQLEEKHFSLPGAQLKPVLSGKSLTETTINYESLLDHELSWADFTVALAGMGADGHIFGIKPGSPAVGADKQVVGYDWDDYTRITPTFSLIKRLDEVIIYAVGLEKHPQIDKLDAVVPADEQPAQLLKQLKRVVFFNDYKGGLG